MFQKIRFLGKNDRMSPILGYFRGVGFWVYEDLGRGYVAHGVVYGGILKVVNESTLHKSAFINCVFKLREATLRPRVRRFTCFCTPREGHYHP